MSGGPSLLRVQVVGHGRRLDVCLPAQSPVWEFLPEVARGLGGEETGQVPCLVTAAGVRLDRDGDLRRQGVRHGDVLTLATQAEHSPPQVHDDLVLAAHARARVVVPGWGTEAAGHAARAVGGGAVVLALALVAAAPRPGLGGALVAVGLPILLAVASTSGRQHHPRWWHVALAWLAAAGAATAASVLVAPTLWSAYVPLGAAAVVSAVLAVRAGPEGVVHATPLLVATVWAAGTLLAGRLGVPPWQVVLVAVVVAVLVAGALPGAVVELTVARGQSDSAPVDVDRLDGDLALAHRMVLASSLVGTSTLLCVVPYAVEAGAAHAVTVLLVVLLRWLRGRHHRSWALTSASIAGGGACLLTLALCAGVLRPDWTPAALVAVGCVAVGAVVGPVLGQSPWARWALDGLEVLMVVCLPLAVVAALWWPDGPPGWPTW
ncbi:EsaB/YukD family protein [Nocardioides sp. Y6]|uniref:EsaB/YukD family protein n=1 Tax=Nocardioides malaquae TaxID=2773426 RepID=A0ABR9RS99_9ACTN|nr:EsaB/YukD family protein [Nocardioides malaquae]MBE7324047.1 EsaB/YukD family protein [Nocardioides malaquae]